MRTVTCVICGRQVETSHSTQKTCGDEECRKEHVRRLAREHYAKFGRTSPRSPRKPRIFPKEYVTREAFAKLKAEIFAPIGDDEPLRKYVG